jgi:hypothetical protein
MAWILLQMRIYLKGLPHHQNLLHFGVVDTSSNIFSVIAIKLRVVVVLRIEAALVHIGNFDSKPNI